MMKGFAKSYFKKGVIRRYVEPSPLHYYVYRRHDPRDARNKPINTHKNVFIFCTISNSELCNTASGIGLEEPKVTMVGERIRRDPWGEAERWKEKGKVWRKLEKGGITIFMEKLHDFNTGVTKVMVDT